MNRKRKLPFMAAAVIALTSVLARSAPPLHAETPKASLLAAGFQGSTGSTVGPDGALYVAEGAAGRISRVDPNTGEITTFATGLPTSGAPFGSSPVDVAFMGETAYALVTLVSPDVGGKDIDGIYRVDGPNSFTVVANIGRWSIAHPPKPAFFVPSGVQYALESYRGGFLVTDGHHNRVLWVTVDRCMSSPPDDSNISELIAFDDIVPTGLTTSGNIIYMAEAGPVPHLPKDGKVVEFGFKSPSASEVASGARLVVDVEFGPHHQLYALSQGVWAGQEAGDPALPNTGSLVKVNDDGGFTLVTDHLDRPTSLEFIGNTAYFVSLAGEVWKIEHVSRRQHHDSR
jgi:hypothetical protein